MIRTPLCTLLATAAMPAIANDASEDAADADRQRDEIVVTGQRDSGYRAELATGTRDGASLLDTPQSVQVLTEELLRDQRADTFSVFFNTPSVRQTAAPGFDGLRVSTRGFSSPIALDGLVTRDSAANLGPDLTGIARVEVLLGPASLLFGNSSPGGTVNFVTKQPESAAAYFVTAPAGSYDFYRGEADLTGPLAANGGLLYRLSTSNRSQGSYLDGARIRNTVIMPSATIVIGPSTRLTVEGAYKQLLLDRQNYGLPASGTVLPNPNGRIPRDRNLNEGKEEVEQHRIGYRFAHSFGDDWSLAHIVRYVATDYIVNNGRLPQALAADGRSVPRTEIEELTNYRAYQSQTNLLGKVTTGGVVHNILMGFDASRSTARFRPQRFPLVTPIDVFDPVFGAPRGPRTGAPDDSTRLDELGIFFQDRLAFGEQLQLVLGGRFDTFEQRNTNNLTNVTVEQSGSAFSPRIGLIYQPPEAISLYANYSKSFQPQIGRAFSGAQFEPTRGEQQELGIKADITNGLAATVAVYRITQTNVTTPDPVNLEFSIQAGEQESKGFEIGLAGAILPGWNIATSYAYLDAKITETTTAAFLASGRRCNHPTRSASGRITRSSRAAWPASALAPGYTSSMIGRWTARTRSTCRVTRLSMPRFPIGSGNCAWR